MVAEVSGTDVFNENVLTTNQREAIGCPTLKIYLSVHILDILFHNETILIQAISLRNLFTSRVIYTVHLCNYFLFR